MENSPLVSIRVITYNSSKYVLETLESAKAQTYQNIELIVSDDCSTDNTVELCREWIEKNKERFVRTEIVTSEVNTGIPANVNRAIKACRGEWMKGIAGDDILANDCVEQYIKHIVDNEGIYVSKMQAFCTTDEGKLYLEVHPFVKNIPFFSLSSQKQYKYLLRRSFNFAPTSFMSKKTVEQLNGYDERNTYLEDLPFWLKATKSGIQIKYFDFFSVYYRTLHNSAVFQQEKVYNTKFYSCLFRFRREYIYKELSIVKYPFFYVKELKNYIDYYFIVYVLRNKRSSLEKMDRLTRIPQIKAFLKKVILKFIKR